MSKTASNLKDFSRLEKWLDKVSSTKTTSELTNIVPILNSHNVTFTITNVDSKPMVDLKELQD